MSLCYIIYIFFLDKSQVDFSFQIFTRSFQFKTYRILWLLMKRFITVFSSVSVSRLDSATIRFDYEHICTRFFDYISRSIYWRDAFGGTNRRSIKG